MRMCTFVCRRSAKPKTVKWAQKWIRFFFVAFVFIHMIDSVTTAKNDTHSQAYWIARVTQNRFVIAGDLLSFCCRLQQCQCLNTFIESNWWVFELQTKQFQNISEWSIDISRFKIIIFGVTMNPHMSACLSLNEMVSAWLSRKINGSLPFGGTAIRFYQTRYPPNKWASPDSNTIICKNLFSRPKKGHRHPDNGSQSFHDWFVSNQN